MDRLDRAWLAKHPLPPFAPEGGKDARGRVLVVGGAEFVPGALRLTGEAALRAGAGKLQLATVRAAAMALAVLVPEAAMIALPADDDGEIACEAAELLADRISRCDCLVLGPGMSATERTSKLVSAIVDLGRGNQTIVLDAAALTCARDLKDTIAASRCGFIMTPHYLEMSLLTGKSIEAIADDPTGSAQRTADEFQAVVVLKGVRTVVASPQARSLVFEGGNKGLATGGSGDVLAGIIGGLAARGTRPRDAASWGVFLHGAAGEKLASEIAEVGYLARDLSRAIPALIAELS